MSKSLRNGLSRATGAGLTMARYAGVAIRNPRLFKLAVDHVLARRARRAESARRARDIEPLGAPDPGGVRPLAELLEGLSRHMGVLVLSRESNSAAIGVAEIDLLAAIAHLRSAAPGAVLSIGPRKANPDSRSFNRQALRAATIKLSADGHDGGQITLSLEPYYKSGPQKWVSNNSTNAMARGLYDDRLETPGLYDIGTVLNGPSLAQVARQRPVDVVYTWVNNADPEWRRMRAAHDAAHAPAGAAQTDATALSRFHNNDELRYSLRSVAQNLAWVNRIHVVTNCAPPDWLVLPDDRLVWVRHEEIIPAQYLPTFNSHAIESCLHRLPGLADEFLYLNDDVFIAVPLCREFFFENNGLTRSFLEPFGMVSGGSRSGDLDYLNASRNSARLIHDTLGFVPTQLHRHSPFALNRSILAEIEDRFPEEMARTRSSRMRRQTDLNLTSFLYHHYAIGTKRAVSAKVECVLVKSLDIRWKDQLANAARPATQTFCINEGGVEPPAPNWHRTVTAFLQDRFPTKAPWER